METDKKTADTTKEVKKVEPKRQTKPDKIDSIGVPEHMYSLGEDPVNTLGLDV